MSAVEDAVRRAIEEFAQTLTALSPATGQDAEQFRAQLTSELHQGLQQRLPYILTGGSSRLICDMPNNQHGFSSSNPKHCNGCGADFCTSHSLTHCVVCGHTV
jgi:hypothetical protein